MLYDKYGNQGLEILAFPCNQFGGQEPGSNAEIRAFVDARGGRYPVFSKIDVNGPNAHPIYQFLKETAPSTGMLGGLLGKDIKWNFAKFLVDGDGRVVKKFEPPSSPLSFESDIASLLK